mgnify:CR=1 FL=1
MNKLTLANYKKMPWKNGLGITYEIVQDRLNKDGNHSLDDFGYRISMADVTSNGAFSLFNHKARLLAVIDGAGMHLNIDKHHDMTVKTFDVIVFDGASEVDSRLIDGAIRDLNVIYDPQRFDANLQWLARPQTVNSQADTVVVLSLEDDTIVSIANQTLTLQKYESVIMVKQDSQFNKNFKFHTFDINKPCMLIEVVKLVN